MLDAMRGLPRRHGHAGRTVQLRGSDRVAILIDGKQSGLTGIGNQTGLDSIPAGSIRAGRGHQQSVGGLRCGRHAGQHRLPPGSHAGVTAGRRPVARRRCARQAQSGSPDRARQLLVEREDQSAYQPRQQLDRAGSSSKRTCSSKKTCRTTSSRRATTTTVERRCRKCPRTASKSSYAADSIARSTITGVGRSHRCSTSSTTKTSRRCPSSMPSRSSSTGTGSGGRGEDRAPQRRPHTHARVRAATARSLAGSIQYTRGWEDEAYFLNDRSALRNASDETHSMRSSTRCRSSSTS